MKTYLLIFHETKGALSIKATSVMFASIVIHFQDITIVANKVFSRQKHKPKNQNSQISLRSSIYANGNGHLCTALTIYLLICVIGGLLPIAASASLLTCSPMGSTEEPARPLKTS